MTFPVQTPNGIEAPFDLRDYHGLLAYAGVVVVMAAGIVAASHLPFLKPRKSTRVKQMTYESGVDPIGGARMRFDIRFYLIAILFLVFDVELLFLYPWAVTAFAETSDPARHAAFEPVVFFEILVFLATLAIAYLYAWKQGVLQWR